MPRRKFNPSAREIKRPLPNPSSCRPTLTVTGFASDEKIFQSRKA